jgi:hypothetical protein
MMMRRSPRWDPHPLALQTMGLLQALLVLVVGVQLVLYSGMY